MQQYQSICNVHTRDDKVPHSFDLVVVSFLGLPLLFLGTGGKASGSMG